MVKIKEFRGLRPIPEKAEAVASPPYDVLDSREARIMAQDKPYSFLHVVKPEIDLPEETDIYSDAVYNKGRGNLDRLIKEGILIQDSKPSFYFYRLTMGDLAQTGLVAAASIEDYENDLIKKHEHTRAEKEGDRIRHVETLNANTGPVFLTYRSTGEMTSLTEEVTRKAPLYDFTADNGVRHTFWKIEDPETLAGIRDIFAGIERLYVADGHHRSAAGTKVGQKRRAENPSHTGDEEYNYFLAVLFPHDQLHIMGYNRVVGDLNGLSPEEFLGRVAESFEIVPATGNRPFSPPCRTLSGCTWPGNGTGLPPGRGVSRPMIPSIRSTSPSCSGTFSPRSWGSKIPARTRGSTSWGASAGPAPCNGGSTGATRSPFPSIPPRSTS